MSDEPLPEAPPEGAAIKPTPDGGPGEDDARDMAAAEPVPIGDAPKAEPDEGTVKTEPGGAHSQDAMAPGKAVPDGSQAQTTLPEAVSSGTNKSAVQENAEPCEATSAGSETSEGDVEASKCAPADGEAETSEENEEGGEEGTSTETDALEGNEEEDEDDDEETDESTDGTSSGAPAATEYVEGEDGNIRINEEQKAAIRRLTQPDDQDDIHLGFTKQGKPIVANPYYKYALRLRDGARDTKPPSAPVTEPHSSRLTRRSRRESTELPMGPSVALEKVKEEFCEWLRSLGSKRNLTVSKDRLDELFSLGLENNMVVRPPEVRMIRPGLPTRTSQETAGVQKGGHRQQKRHASVAFCRSPSLTYYPELRERWRQMGRRRQLPTWHAGYRAAAAPPPPRVTYGSWYIPIGKWTPLVDGRRLTPPETEEARELRQRELEKMQLNEVLSKSHAMAALREYIRICRAHGDSSFPDATPKMVRDVDQLLAAQERERRPSVAAAARRRRRHRPSPLRAGAEGVVRVLVPSAVSNSSEAPGARAARRHARSGGRRLTAAQCRAGLLMRPPPRFEPLKTAPGPAATRRD